MRVRRHTAALIITSALFAVNNGYDSGNGTSRFDNCPNRSQSGTSRCNYIFYNDHMVSSLKRAFNEFPRAVFLGLLSHREGSKQWR